MYQRRYGICRINGNAFQLFRELPAVGILDQRDVQERRRRETQQAVKPDLSRRRQQEVRAAHDMRDALGGIIHDHGELVGEWPVGTADDEIADIAREILADMALQAILEAEQ